MSFQHLEFITQLRDAERLRLYVESRLSARAILDASLKEAQLTIRRLKLEAKEAVDRVAREETEKDAARYELAMAWLEIEAAGSARCRLRWNCPESKVL